MGKLIIIILILAIIALGGYFIFKGGYQSPKTGSTIGLGGKEITVIGADFSFNPSEIRVKALEKVKIIFQNKGDASHNLTIEGLGISTKTISSGKTDAIEFVSPASGTYNFFCSIPGHKTAGMTGSLIVE
jgi:uncharacterized cupredoxin-like copper-binding protein